MNATTYIKATGLRKEFKRASGERVNAIDRIDLDIAQGAFVAIIGPSGCGKTTLLRCIAGLETPDDGDIVFGTTTVFSRTARADLPPEDRDIAMLFQSYALWPHMTVMENVTYPLKLKGVSKSERRARGQAMLEKVQCGGLAEQYPSQISGGQQQRIALARALVTNNALVLFDEPLSNIDTRVRRQMRGEIRALQKEFGFTAIYVTHDQEEAFSLADTLIVLEKGRIAQMGSPKDVYLHPRSRYVAEFMGEVNLIKATTARADGAVIRLETPMGPILANTEGCTDPAHQTLFAFRPQKCRVNPDPARSGTSQANILHGTLLDKKFLGAYTEILVQMGDRNRFTCTTPGDVTTEIGAPVTIEIEARDIFALG